MEKESCAKSRVRDSDSAQIRSTKRRYSKREAPTAILGNRVLKLGIIQAIFLRLDVFETGFFEIGQQPATKATTRKQHYRNEKTKALPEANRRAALVRGSRWY